MGTSKTGVILTPRAQDEVLAILPWYIQAKVHLPAAKPASTEK